MGRRPVCRRVVGDDVYGRGACDMKGGLVAILAAVAAIRTAGVRLRGRVAVHCVVSEEDGGLGAFGTLQRGHTGNACIVAEPTSGTLVTANAGALTFRIEVSGRATHGSTRYAGVSAIDAFLPVHRALAELEARRNHAANEPLMAEWPIRIRCPWAPYGRATGRAVCPTCWSPKDGSVCAWTRTRPVPGNNLRTRSPRRAPRPRPHTHPAMVSWPGGQFASVRLPPGHPRADIVAGAHAEANGVGRIRERGAPYGSDLRLYRAAGIPTLQYGPDVRLAHGPDEKVSLRQVAAVARGLVLATLRTVGTG